MVRQYRHNLRSYQLEFPAGTVHETEEPETAARRELEEETGFTPAAPATRNEASPLWSSRVAATIRAPLEHR